MGMKTRNFLWLLCLFLSVLGVDVLSSCTGCETTGKIPEPGPPQQAQVVIHLPVTSLDEACTDTHILQEFPNITFPNATMESEVVITVFAVYPDASGTTGSLKPFKGPGPNGTNTYVFNPSQTGTGFYVYIPSSGTYDLRVRFNYILLPNDDCYSCDCCAAKCASSPYFEYGTLSYETTSEFANYSLLNQIYFTDSDINCDCCKP